MKNVLLTGSTGTLGEKIIEKLKENNYNVIGTYNSNENKALEIKNKYQIELIKCNLQNEKDINNLVDKVITKYKKIDILINNAAFYQDEPLNEKTKETFLKVLDINLVSPFLLSKKIGKYMLENKNGKIINIVSTNGIDTYYPESIDYDASKAGLINLTKNLALYYAPYIKVNAIAPGWIETKETLEMDKTFIENEKNNILLNRFAHPEEIVDGILFLCRNEYINGEVIRIDGGKK